MIFMLGLFACLPALSPKNFEVDSFRSTYLFVMVLIVGLFGYMQGVILYAAWTGHLDVVRAMVGGLYLFFALIGNVLERCAGISTSACASPWTLASDRVLERYAPRRGLGLRDRRAHRVRHRDGRWIAARLGHPVRIRGRRADRLRVRPLQAARATWGALKSACIRDRLGASRRQELVIQGISTVTVEAGTGSLGCRLAAYPPEFLADRADTGTGKPRVALDKVRLLKKQGVRSRLHGADLFRVRVYWVRLISLPTRQPFGDPRRTWEGKSRSMETSSHDRSRSQRLQRVYRIIKLS